MGKEERGRREEKGDRGLGLALLSRLFFIAMVFEGFSPRVAPSAEKEEATRKVVTEWG